MGEWTSQKRHGTIIALSECHTIDLINNRDNVSQRNFPGLQESRVKLDIDQFWKLLSDSELLHEDQIADVKSKWPASEPTEVARAMVTEKVISPLHSEVLLAGHSGPFIFGRYLVTNKFSDNSENNLFRQYAGRDLRTQHPVLLSFFTGSSATAVSDWKRIEARVRQLAKCRQPNLLETFQTISLPDYRFIISELPVGKRLSEKLPPKGRLKLAQASPIVLQLALAIESQESQIESGFKTNLPAPEEIPKQVWLMPKSVTKFQPQWISKQSSNSMAPAESLLALLLRMTGGNYPKTDNIKALIEKSGVDGNLKTMANKAFAEETGKALELANLIGALKQLSPELPKQTPPKSLAAFRQVLATSQRLATSAASPVEDVPGIGTDGETASLENSNDPRVLAAREAAQQRKSGRWKMPVAIATTLMAMLTIGGIWALTADQKVISRVEPQDTLNVAVANSTTPATQPDNINALDQVVAKDFSNVAYVQEILNDDATRLWESPTTGKPIDFLYAPSSTEILIHIRPHELLKSNEGQRLISGLSKTFAEPLKTLSSSVGLPLSQIETLTAALYPGNSGSYEVIVRATAIYSVSIDDLKAVWGDVDEVRTREGKRIFATGEMAYLISSSDSDEAISFVSGSPKLVQELSAVNGENALALPMQRLASRTDRDQHISFLASPKSLTDAFGRKLWGEFSDSIVPRLRIFFPDEINAFSLQLHLDDADYLELHVDQSPGVSATDLQQQLDIKIRKTVLEVGAFADGLPEIEYWDSVRQRILPMANLLVSGLRWDVEFGNVIANAWLPPDAAQNLIAASELTLAFANTFAPPELADAKPTPQTIEELLASKRSLNIANPPDLNVLLSELASDINDDFPEMPFQFKIKLMGNDLQKEGITQNQRPGPLAFKDLALSDILTKIMTSANPSKDISGPADPNCKLVWVVVDDAGTTNKQVAVTTRAAATERSEPLPAAFVTP